MSAIPPLIERALDVIARGDCAGAGSIRYQVSRDFAAPGGNTGALDELVAWTVGGIEGDEEVDYFILDERGNLTVEQYSRRAPTDLFERQYVEPAYKLEGG